MTEDVNANNYAVCPSCLANGLVLSQQHADMFKCQACGQQISIDVYLLSLQLVQFNIVLQAMKTILSQYGWQMGICVLYMGIQYVVGFDKNGMHIVSKYQLPDWVQGSIVKINCVYQG